MLVSAKAPVGNYSVQERWKLGGEGGWSGLTADPQFHRLYVARSNRVMVVDTQTGKPVGEIAEFGSVRSVCLDVSGKFGYITDTARNVVEVFDRATLKLVAWVPAGTAPDAAVFDTASHAVYVFNTRSRSATIIDAVSNTVVGSVELPGKPVSAVSDDKGQVFVTLADKGQIAAIDTRTRKLAASWPVAGCVGPNGLAIDRERNRLYTACENKQVVMLNSTTGKIMAAAELGDGARDVVFDDRSKLLLAVNTGGVITVVRTSDTGEMVAQQKVQTQAGARVLALDATSDRVYLATSQFGLRTKETSEELLFRPTPVPGSFVVLVVGE